MLSLHPSTVKNFLALCASGYYDKTHFHRNVQEFLIQGGDPTGTGKGGKDISGGFFADEFHSSLRHDRRGVVAMANKGPDSNGSQFYITYSSQPQLDQVSTVFGKVIHGFDTLDAMERQPVGKKFRPEKPIVIESVQIHSNPFAEKET